MRDVVNTGWAEEEEEEEEVFAFKGLMAMPTSDFVSLIKATQPLSTNSNQSLKRLGCCSPRGSGLTTMSIFLLR